MGSIQLFNFLQAKVETEKQCKSNFAICNSELENFGDKFVSWI